MVYLIIRICAGLSTGAYWVQLLHKIDKYIWYEEGKWLYQEPTRSETSGIGMEPITNQEATNNWILKFNFWRVSLLPRMRNLCVIRWQWHIFLVTFKQENNQSIKDIKSTGSDIQEIGDIENYLGINIKNLQYFWLKLTQPQILLYIINQVHITPNATTIQTPFLMKNIIRCDAASTKFKGWFHYHWYIRRFKVIEKSTPPKIA